MRYQNENVCCARRGICMPKKEIQNIYMDGSLSAFLVRKGKQTKKNENENNVYTRPFRIHLDRLKGIFFFVQ